MATNLHNALARLERHVAERRARCPAPSVSSRRGAMPRPLPGDDRPRLFTDRCYRERPFHSALPIRLEGLPERILSYTGPQLALDDRAVWRGLLKLYRPRGQQDRSIEFSATGLLRALGWAVNRRGQDRLRRCLLRLQSATLGLPDDDGRATRYGSLIHEARCRQTQGGRALRWEVRIPPEVRALFGHD
jgi:hypothetical protein